NRRRFLTCSFLASSASLWLPQITSACHLRRRCRGPVVLSPDGRNLRPWLAGGFGPDFDKDLDLASVARLNLSGATVDRPFTLRFSFEGTFRKAIIIYRSETLTEFARRGNIGNDQGGTADLTISRASVGEPFAAITAWVKPFEDRWVQAPTYDVRGLAS